jgi:hypothetical protein
MHNWHSVLADYAEMQQFASAKERARTRRKSKWVGNSSLQKRDNNFGGKDEKNVISDG